MSPEVATRMRARPSFSDDRLPLGAGTPSGGQPRLPGGRATPSWTGNRRRRCLCLRWCCPHAHPFTGAPEDAEYFSGFRPRAAEPVRHLACPPPWSCPGPAEGSSSSTPAPPTTEPPPKRSSTSLHRSGTRARCPSDPERCCRRCVRRPRGRRRRRPYRRRWCAALGADRPRRHARRSGVHRLVRHATTDRAGGRVVRIESAGSRA